MTATTHYKATKRAVRRSHRMARLAYQLTQAALSPGVQHV